MRSNKTHSRTQIVGRKFPGVAADIRTLGRGPGNMFVNISCIGHNPGVAQWRVLLLHE